MDRVFFIGGPTASGKSEIAVAVAERSGAEIVSADAFQIYNGLPLLTAQPDESMFQRVPHHLVGMIPPTEEMNAQKFRELALLAIREINARGKLALVVGGSGLYLKALTHGLAPLPSVDPKLRAALNALSLAELNARLAAADPATAERIDRQNKRRVVRALEIFMQTKQPPSEQRSQWKTESTQSHGVLLFRDRSELHTRINRRVEDMFNDGVVEEVATIRQPGSTAAKALGFEQIRQLLDKKISQEECIQTIQQLSRRYAKRQLTWFRRQLNFESLNLSLLKDRTAAVDWILQKVSLLRPLE